MITPMATVAWPLPIFMTVVEATIVTVVEATIVTVVPPLPVSAVSTGSPLLTSIPT